MLQRYAKHLPASPFLRIGTNQSLDHFELVFIAWLTLSWARMSSVPPAWWSVNQRVRSL